MHALIASAACVPAASIGSITSNGDVEPANPGTWTSSTTGYVGRTADGTLTVSAGSTLLANSAYLGYAVGVTGTVGLAGSGSTWNERTLYDGLAGNGILSISTGAKFTDTSAYLGYSNGSVGTISVNGTGSTWTASSSVFVGTSGAGVLSIAAGGSGTTAASYVGYNANSSGTVTVDGANSTWTTSGLFMGYSGAGTLNITNGGKASIASGYLGYLGYNANSSGTVTVDGANSSWTNSGLSIGYSGAGTLNITNHATVSVAGLTTLASNAGSSGEINFGSNGGTLLTQQLYGSPSQITGTGTISTQGLVSDGSILFDTAHGASQTMLWNSGGQNVSLKLDLTGASGTVGDLGAGYESSGTLTIHNGVAVKSARGFLGYDAGSTGSATVDGAGSSWTTSGLLYAGYGGSGMLNVTGGSNVTGLSSGYFGYNSGSAGAGTVSGSGSSLKLTSNLYVGNNGAGTLSLGAGGGITESVGYLGYSGGSTGDAAVVGVGSSWTNSSDLYVGDSGAATLSITSGGTVTNNNGFIGVAAGSTGNVTVDGLGSVWSNKSNLTVGSSGYGTLNITDSGLVTVVGPTTVGSTGTINFGSQGGTLTTASLMAPRAQVIGSGTINTRGLYDDGNLLFNAASGARATDIWSGAQQNVTVNLDLSGLNGAAGDLGVGYQSTGTLTVLDGVTIQSASGHLGYLTGSNGTGTVLGAGSRWTDAGGLYVGQSGGGALSIVSGGEVSTGATSYVGYNLGAVGTVQVDGTGSTWSNSSNVDVGYSGAGSLNITQGAQVSSVSTTNNYNNIGYNKGASGTVTVDGTGSNWSIVDGANSGYRGLVVGYYGSGGLSITNGGGVSSSDSGYIAEWTGSSGTVTVDGMGSTWNNGYELNVGYSGVGALTVSNGGQVNSSIHGSNGASSIGNNQGSSGVVTVDGPGSVWDCNSFLDVGNGGNGTLNITNGGNVVVAGATYIADPASGGGTGFINFGPNGGTLTTQGLYGPHSQITGTGTINARGVYYDGDLTFDATHGAVQTELWQGPQQNVTFNLDLSGSSGSSGDLAVGYLSSGSLTISDGLHVTTGYGYLGYKTSALGAATIQDPGSTWNYNNAMYVGLSGAGSLNILKGGSVYGAGQYSYIFVGCNSGSSGTASVDGAGSNWTVNDLYRLYVGYGSAGTLSISNGGSLKIASIESESDCFIGYNGGPNGSGGPAYVDVTGIGSTWTFTDNTANATQTFSVGYAAAGTLQVNDGGSVICSSNNTSYVGNSGPGIAKVDGAGSNWTAGKQLTIGDYGSGELDITNGGQVNSGSGYLGYTNATPGTVKVDGAGSDWNAGTHLYVGYLGPGVLNITNGGNVSSAASNLNSDSGSAAMATVDGVGSSWNAGTLVLGLFVPGDPSGTALLAISNGGNVTASSVTIGGTANGSAPSVLSINAGDGSSLDVGTGSISNSGIIRVRAAWNAAAGDTYAPVTAGSWSGTGSVQAIGGTWNSATHQFTASAIATGTSGSAVAIDRRAESFGQYRREENRHKVFSVSPRL
jgi:T5SS/PEP-CTERM-associated repeat protein